MTDPRRRRFAPEVRERAVRLVGEHAGEHASQWAAIRPVAAKTGCGSKTLRNWVRQTARDRGQRAGPTAEDRERVKALERENREPRQANAILRKAGACFAQAEPTGPMQASLHGCPPTAGSGHDRLRRRSPRGARGRADLPGADDRPVHPPLPRRPAARPGKAAGQGALRRRAGA
jgi:transposase-like protein